jgi:hypothetical protein
VFIPWHNVVQFFLQYVALFNQKVKQGENFVSSAKDDDDEDEGYSVDESSATSSSSASINVPESFISNRKVTFNSTNVMDRWILASTTTLINNIRNEMSKFIIFFTIIFL